MMKVTFLLLIACFLLFEAVEMRRGRCWWACHDHNPSCRYNCGKKGGSSAGGDSVLEDTLKLRTSNSHCKFEVYDNNADGSITKEEMKSVLLKNGPIKQHAMTAFIVMDENEDDLVTLEEFNKALPTLLKAGAVDACYM